MGVVRNALRYYHDLPVRKDVRPRRMFLDVDPFLFNMRERLPSKWRATETSNVFLILAAH
jgi:hypothetical protein